jgi:glycosyltransferase involved in cell wall biosynthesis
VTRPRIGVDLRALVGRPSGIGYFTLSLLEHLARRGTADYIGLAHAAPHGLDRLREVGVEIETQPAPLGVWWQQVELPRRLRRGDVDLFWSPLYTLPLRLAIPSVVTVHDLTAVLFPETHRLKVKLSLLPFLRRSLDQAEIVAADSRATADDVGRQFPEIAAKVRVVYPGVDREFRPASREEIAATRERLGCRAGYVLFVGTIEPRKNLGVLLDAWESLHRRDASALPLVVAGSYGWRSRTTMARVESLDADSPLVWVKSPERPALVELVQGARALVLPSLYEGFGLPAAEAMACGVPAIVSDRSSLPEVVAGGGVTFEADDVDGLAHLLERVAFDLEWAAELGARGLETAKRFDWDDSARAMEEIFRDALG